MLRTLFLTCSPPSPSSRRCDAASRLCGVFIIPLAAAACFPAPRRPGPSHYCQARPEPAHPIRPGQVGQPVRPDPRCCRARRRDPVAKPTCVSVCVCVCACMCCVCARCTNTAAKPPSSLSPSVCIHRRSSRNPHISELFNPVFCLARARAGACNALSRIQSPVEWGPLLGAGPLPLDSDNDSDLTWWISF